MNEIMPEEFRVVANYSKMSTDSLISPKLLRFPSVAEDIVMDTMRLRVVKRKDLKK